jgi:hypothetical protein
MRTAYEEAINKIEVLEYEPSGQPNAKLHTATVGRVNPPVPPQRHPDAFTLHLLSRMVLDSLQFLLGFLLQQQPLLLAKHDLLQLLLTLT